jgi:hypothetical protein
MGSFPAALRLPSVAAAHDESETACKTRLIEVCVVPRDPQRRITSIACDSKDGFSNKKEERLDTPHCGITIRSAQVNAVFVTQCTDRRRPAAIGNNAILPSLYLLEGGLRVQAARFFGKPAVGALGLKKTSAIRRPLRSWT